MKIIKEEVKKYKGIKYKLVLAIDDNMYRWWYSEPIDKDLAKIASSNFLTFSTKSFEKNRLQDKYHACEIEVMQHINLLLGIWRTKWIATEIKMYLILEIKIIHLQIWFNLLKLFRFFSLEEKIARQIKK
ncbi:MAG TPA: hypothetical protein DDY21_00085 [Candidatus Moranbacteria bacterium]|nr:hypothetical protein [Candidatus Moranbacteria bacterium]